MTISLTVNATDGDDLRRQLADLLGTASAAIGPAPTKARPTKTESAPRAEPEPDTSATATTASDDGAAMEAGSGQSEQAESADEGADVNGAVSGDGVPTKEDFDNPKHRYNVQIKPAVLKVSAKHGRPGVEKLLADFKAANAKEIQQSRYDDFMAAIDKLLG